MGWDLSKIRRKTRQVTGRLSTDQMSNYLLDEYINNFYIYTLPAEVKLEYKHTFYEFETEANVQNYAYPSTVYTNVEPPFYLNGQKIDYYQNPEYFYSRNPTSYSLQTTGTGDAVTVAFTSTLTGAPLISGSVLCTDNVENITDNGDGTLTGTDGGSGTIDYTTGDITITFAAAPANGQSITARYLPYRAATPTAVLNYDNQFTFFPIPDTAYPCKIKAYKIFTPLTSATDTPDLEEWGPAIAYGASRDIHSDYGEIDRYAEVTMLYKEQIDYILTRTAQSLSTQRASPSY